MHGPTIAELYEYTNNCLMEHEQNTILGGAFL